MAYDEHLAERIKRSLDSKKVPYLEKLMMGGWCAMVDEKMCIGIVKNNIMARIDPQSEDEYLSMPGVRPMDFTGRPMNGYLFVSPEAIDLDTDLDFWVDQCLQFNPRAKSSRKK